MIIIIALQIWIAVKGNEMVAKNYLERGWTFVEPDSEFTKRAKEKWGIHLDKSAPDAMIHSPALATAAPLTSSESASSDYKYCFKCGKKTPENAVFCPSCGASQALPTQATS